MAPVSRRNPTLSEDLISQILLRVPVKSLLRFYSVSKTWLSLIKNRAFVKSQLRHALATQTDQTLLSPHKFSLFHVDSRQNVARLRYPYPRGEYQYSVSCIRLVGCANGIVCIEVRLYFENINCEKTDICLWNPAIRQSKLIPSLFNASDNIKVEALGFGYDEVSNDYKVATCVVMNPRSNSLRYVVYSDNRNAWRNVPQHMDYPRMDDFHACINGFICGIGRSYGMMAFDLNQEVLNCGIKLPVIDDAHAQHLLNCAIKLPITYDAHDAHDDGGGGDPRIIEFNNSVAVIKLMGSNKKINMWTLDDDVCLRGGGVEASWTPMFSIDLSLPIEMFSGYFSNGNLRLLVLIDDVKLWFSCNAETKEAKIAPPLVDLADHHSDHVIYNYKETLVSLAGFGQVN